ncbi:MAG: ABC transporter ATP-binding protein [Pseudomonadota bacterium]|nr:ABC transporter ATP-binding protein [Pseudomonadota bacterium]
MIECKDIFKTYDDGSKRTTILSNVNFKLNTGDSASIIGKSGSGKTTLLHLLSGLEKATSGNVKIDGKNLSKMSDKALTLLRREKISFVYQFHHLIFELNVIENILLPLHIRNYGDDKSINLAKDIIKNIGLGKRMHYQVDKLSGGERQRVAIARAVVCKPEILFADEPTGNLDKKNALNIFSILEELVKEFNTSLILATHDELLARKSNKCYLIENSKLKTT